MVPRRSAPRMKACMRGMRCARSGSTAQSSVTARLDRSMRVAAHTIMMCTPPPSGLERAKTAPWKPCRPVYCSRVLAHRPFPP
ncbi:hypothetical protein P8C59_005883 [Phyllachora maydis]|uniref:Uncharacterized protein n=1 Tax=Phyllachora maydis TaxID=1825666 RepID=A0AAD9MFZ4_9PEZI|nr:hypothetical protein P8C59_005883 [Phyllachora maydis]